MYVVVWGCSDPEMLRAELEMDFNRLWQRNLGLLACQTKEG